VSECKFRPTNRIVLYIMVFGIFLNVCCPPVSLEQLRTDIGSLEKTIQDLEEEVGFLKTELQKLNGEYDGGDCEGRTK